MGRGPPGGGVTVNPGPDVQTEGKWDLWGMKVSGESRE